MSDSSILRKRYDELTQERVELQQKRQFLNNLLHEVRNLNNYLKSEKQELARKKAEEYIIPDHVGGLERSFPVGASTSISRTTAPKMDEMSLAILDNPEHINRITLNLSKNANALDNTFKDAEEEFDDSDEEMPVNF